MTTADDMHDDATPPADETQTLRDELAAAREALLQAQREAEAQRRRERLDALLVEAGAIDLEATRHLIGNPTDADDLDAAVANLAKRKPHLFRRPSEGGSGAMGPRAEPPGTEQRAEDAATHARRTGSPGDLLRYLRLRRGRT